MSIERPWLAHYPEGVPAQIDINQYTSLAAVVEEAFERFRHRPAFSSFDKVLTYGQIDEMSRQFAGYLTGELKLGKGDRIAIMMPNVLQYPIALFGALRAGLVVVNTNPMYTARELKHQLEDAGAKAIVVLDNFAATLQQVVAETHVEHIITTGIGDLLGAKGVLINFVLKHVKKMVPPFQLPHAVRFTDALSKGAPHPMPKVQLGHEDIAFLQYTGGTTGVAKGAMLTHGNMVANMLQAGAWIGNNAKQGEEVIITALPLYHIFSLTANLLTFAMAGGLSVLIPNPRDLQRLIRTMGSGHVTTMTGVNTLFNALVNTPEFADLDFRELRLVIGGGAAVQSEVARRWQAITGTALVEGYGLTEASPVVCINPVANPKIGTVGLPVPSTEVSVRDNDGNALGLGEDGEVWVRGPQVMQGYWRRPDETKNVLTADGWLRTGDMGVFDGEGFLKLLDRKKDMVVVSGFKVFPNEVEDVAMLHPGVLEAAVIGVPDERTGETVKIFIVRRDPDLTKAALTEYLHSQLAAYKVPHIIEFRDQLPKSNIGKILRKELH
jgi:long-chain acyl-CoA synthetase